MLGNLSMGGYGPYVWTCYGLTFGLIGIGLYHAIAWHRKVKKNLLSQQQ